MRAPRSVAAVRRRTPGTPIAQATRPCRSATATGTRRSTGSSTRRPADPFRTAGNHNRVTSVSVPLCTLVHMVLHMVETLVRAGVTRNISPRPAATQSTGVIHCRPGAAERSVPRVGDRTSAERGRRCGARDRRGRRRTRGDPRVPPQNLEAEESVLGSMMLSAEAIADVVEIVEPDDFYRSRERQDLRHPARALRPRRSGRRRSPPSRSSSAAGILEEVGGAPRTSRPRRPGPDARRPPRTTRRIVAETRAAAPADRRGRRHHGHGLLGARGRRARRRRGRAADLRRRAARREGPGRLARASSSTRR